MNKPYVGVTGVMDQRDGQILADSWDHPTHLLMVGVLATSTTLNGGASTRYPNRYPVVSAIKDLWPRDPEGGHHPKTLNLIHYATKNKNTLADQFKLLKTLAGPLCDGIQLNMIWPDVQDVIQARHLFNRVVLQLGPSAMKEAGNDPYKIAQWLTPYKGSITDVLIDASGGKGVPINVAKAHSIAKAVRDMYPDFGLGVAGGLCAPMVPTVLPLLKDFPDMSFDAEGRIRDLKDNLDLDLSQQYLKAFC